MSLRRLPLAALLLLTLAATSLGQRRDSGSTGAGLLGNPGGGGTLGGGSGGGALDSSGSYSTPQGNSGNELQIGAIPEGEVSTIREGGGGTLGGNQGNGGQGSSSLDQASNNAGGGYGNRDTGGNSGAVNRQGSGNNQYRTYDRRGGYYYGNRYWWRGGYWSGGCYACGIWVGGNPNYPQCPACQYFDPAQSLCVTAEDCPAN